MKDRICPSCGVHNSDQANFCRGCGSPMVGGVPAPTLGIPCPQCGVINRSGANFCRNCRARLTQWAGVGASQPRAAMPGAPGPPAQKVLKTVRLEEAPGSQLRLIVRWMGGRIQVYPLVKPALQVGRRPGNDILIDHPAVSAQHLRLTVAPDHCTVTDLNSLNGTLLNGVLIPTNTPQPLAVGDMIRIGDLNGNWVSLMLQVEGAEPVRRVFLEHHDISNRNTVLLGRDPSSYLPLNHPLVSHRHALIFKRDSQWMIRDLGSTNGTFVNGQRITQAPLKSGDVIQIGPFEITYDPQKQSLRKSIHLGHRLDAIGLGREVGKRHFILHDVSITINPGEFVALVGGSGAGKTTLLKAINGFEPANHGQVLLDGKPLYPLLDLYRPQMGYVPQDDIIHQALPVYSALWYSAKLRLPDAKPREIKQRIEDVLKAVDMEEHVRKPIRLLSGGQRKRVNIASELLSHPTLFFLDEPTSGLDPGLEKKMMYDLKCLADQGCTVVLVTHATANITQCDQVAFLTYGRLAYYGPPDEALQFYNVGNFSDIYLKLSQEIDPAKGKAPPPELQSYYQNRFPRGGKVSAGILWADLYRHSPLYKKHVADRLMQLKSHVVLSAQGRPPVQRRRDSILRQSLILTRRMFDLIRLDLRTLFVLLFMVPLIGAMFGMVNDAYVFKGQVTHDYPERDTIQEIQEYFKTLLKGKAPDAEGSEIKYTPAQEGKKLINMLSLALTQSGTFAAVFEIVKERAIFRRERACNLRVSAYVLSKAVVLCSFAIFQVFSSLIALRLLGIELDIPGAIFRDGLLLELFITFYLGMVASIMFGLFISAVIPSADMVMYAILAQLFVQIVLNGALFQVGSTTLSKMTISYWTTVGAGSSVDLPGLNERGTKCNVVEVTDPASGIKSNEVQCIEVKLALLPGGTSDNPQGDYQHEAGKIIAIWQGLILHALVWFLLTYVVMVRKQVE